MSSALENAEWGHTNNKLPLHLVDNRALGDDLAYLVYELERTA